MGLITFTDGRGISWRAWRVETPAAQSHLMDASFRNGWLVFEREDGSERRRLARTPDDWASLSPERLADLCGLAVPAPPRRGTPSTPSIIQGPPDSDPERRGR